MFTNAHIVQRDFHIDRMMRYSLFVPRLYNLCRSLGFEAGKIMPSRAFCADENQGFPIILIAKHFGTFPFDHGRAGGIVATDRHAPHAHHGNDMVIIQASHVGYDPETETFGTYCRQQAPDDEKTATCGKVGGVIQWYQDEYRFAQDSIYLESSGEDYAVAIDNHLLDENRAEGLYLDLDRMILHEDGKRRLLRSMSTSSVFAASPTLRESLPEALWPAGGRTRIGVHLGPEMFSFHRQISGGVEGLNHLERNLIGAMPWIVTSPTPLLTAAQVNSQMEFDRTFRTIVKAREYQGKRLLFVSCLNIDISPRGRQLFPLTKCVPWAAYHQARDGDARTLEQHEISDMLMRQSSENPDQIDLDSAIGQMIDAPEVKIRLGDSSP